MEASDKQPSKQLAGTVVNDALVESVALSREEQFWKALIPILVTLFGRDFPRYSAG